MGSIFLSHSSRDREATRAFVERIKDQGYESLFVDFDPGDGIPSGREWEREIYRALRASDAIIVLWSAASVSSRWCFAEIAVARSLGKQIFPVKIEACDLDGIPTDHQIVDLVAEGEAGYERLWIGLRRAGLDPRDTLVWNPNRSPYPGLRTFDEADAGVFFGRDDEIRAMLDALTRLRRLRAPRMALVLGESGGGKSSLVQAGVLPRLRRDEDSWRIVPPFRPGVMPLRSLAQALAAGAAPPEVASLRDRLRTGGTAFREQVERIVATGRPGETVALLVVDQWEELLGPPASPESDRERAGFHRALRDVLDDPGVPLLALATLRPEFLGAFQSHPAWAGFEFASLPLGPMPPGRFPIVIEGPARRAGLTFEAGLPARLARDAGEANALPLLAFTLRELFERCREAGEITHEVYDRQVGGLRGAVEHAVRDAIGDDLSPAGESALRRAFLGHLVRIDEGGRFLRRRARWDDLPEAARPYLEQFIAARLLSTAEDGPRRTVEVVHEALFQVWDRLRGWLDEGREMLLWRKGIEGEVASWSAAPGAEKAGFLLAGARVAEARRWMARNGDDFTSAERAFITASLEAEDRRKAEEDRRAFERLRLYRRVRTAAFVAGLLALAASAAGVFAWYERDVALGQAVQISSQKQEIKDRSDRIERQAADLARRGEDLRAQVKETARERDRAFGETRRADQRSRIAEARRLAAESLNALPFSPQRGTLLAAESILVSRRAGEPIEPAAETALHDVLASTEGSVLLPGVPGSEVHWFSFLPDGRRVVVLTRPSQFDVHSALRIHRLDRPNDDPLELGDIAGGFPMLGPGGHRLAAMVGQKLFVWDLDRPEAPALPLPIDEGLARSTFLADGRILILSNRAADDRELSTTAEVWDPARPRGRPVVLSGPRVSLLDCIPHPDGRTLIASGSVLEPPPPGPVAGVSGSTSTIWTWDLLRPEAPAVVLGTREGLLRSVTIHPDRRRILADSGDEILSWDLARPGEPPVSLIKHHGRLDQFLLHPDGRRLIATGRADRGSDARTNFAWVKLWDLDHPDAPPTSLSDQGPQIFRMVLHPDGRRLIVSLYEIVRSARVSLAIGLLDLDRPGAEPVVLRGHEGQITRIAPHPDRSRVVTSSADGTLRIWEVERPRSEPLVLSGHAARSLSSSASSDGRQYPSVTSITGTAISRDGRRVASVDIDGVVRLWDLARPRTPPAEARMRSKDQFSFHAAIAFTADEAGLIVAIDRDIWRWDAVARPGAAPTRVAQFADPTFGLKLSPDGRRLVTIGSAFSPNGRPEDRARLWDGEHPDRAPVGLLGVPDGLMGSALDPDGRRLIAWGSSSGGAAGAPFERWLRIWDLGRPEAQPTAQRLPGGIGSALDVHPVGRRLIVLCPIARVWDDPDRRVALLDYDLDRPGDHPREILSVAGSHAILTAAPGGRRLFVQDEAGRVVTADLDRPGAPREVCHLEGMHNLIVHPDGRRLIFGQADGSVLLVDVERPGAQPVGLHGHSGHLSALILCPDGRLLTSGTDGTIRLWNLEIEALFPEAVRRAGRNFTPSEWGRYFSSEPYRRTFFYIP